MLYSINRSNHRAKYSQQSSFRGKVTPRPARGPECCGIRSAVKSKRRTKSLIVHPFVSIPFISSAFHTLSRNTGVVGQVFIHSTNDAIAKPKIIPTGDNARWVEISQVDVPKTSRTRGDVKRAGQDPGDENRRMSTDHPPSTAHPLAHAKHFTTVSHFSCACDGPGDLFRK